MSVPYILLAFAGQLVFMVPTVTVLLLITCVSFHYARGRRRKAEQALEDNED